MIAAIAEKDLNPMMTRKEYEELTNAIIVREKEKQRIQEEAKKQKMRQFEVTNKIKDAVIFCMGSSFDDGAVYDVTVDDTVFSFSPVYNFDCNIISISMGEKDIYKRCYDELSVDYGINMLSNLFSSLIFKRLSIIRKEKKREEKRLEMTNSERKNTDDLKAEEDNGLGNKEATCRVQ